MEVPSPFNGKLRAILVEEGEVVPMGTPIAEMDADGVDAGEVVKEPETPVEGEEEAAEGAETSDVAKEAPTDDAKKEENKD